MKRQLITTVLILAGMATNLSASGLFAERKHLPDGQLELKGIGTARFMSIDLYMAALYLQPDHSTREWYREVPRQLEISYNKPIKSWHFAKATDKLLERGLSADQYRNLQPRIRQFLDLYRDVKPGDRYTLTYIPDKGTQLALNGELLGEIEGQDFSRAVFSIWLGKESISPSLRYQLLGSRE